MLKTLFDTKIDNSDLPVEPARRRKHHKSGNSSFKKTAKRMLKKSYFWFGVIILIMGIILAMKFQPDYQEAEAKLAITKQRSLEVENQILRKEINQNSKEWQELEKKAVFLKE